MEHSETTRELLITHCKTYPNLQIQDIFKFLHQSAFGCEHFVSSLCTATSFIAEEYRGLRDKKATYIEPLDGDYSRVPLSYIDRGLSAETLGRLFVASSKQEPNGMSVLLEKLKVAEQLVYEGLLPFSEEEFDEAMQKWKAQGYEALHHSDIFKASYRPAYRVINNRFIPFLPLLAELDKRLKNGRVILSVEGGSASGKTTLSEMLYGLYDCTVFHMDDFFLQPHQRTPERFAQVGGNIDWERFLSEVLIPLSKGEPVSYRKFDCSAMSLTEEIQVTPKRFTVIEGAYSMHPSLEKYYDLSVYLDIAPSLQRERILHRNSPELAQRFFNEWIPLERRYFSETHAEQRCSMTIQIL